MFSKEIRVSFFAKIFALSLLIVVFTLLVSYIANLLFLDKFYIYRKKQMMQEIIQVAKEYSIKGNEQKLAEYISQAKEIEGVEINIDRKSLRMSSSENMMMGGHMSMGTKIPLNEFYIRNLPGVGALILYYGEKLPNGRNIYVSTSLSVMTAHKHENNLFNLISGIFALAFSILVGAYFSKKITKDIALLRDKADKISKLEFPEEIAIDRNDEIGDLSRSLEKMSQNLSSSINNLKSFTSTASHELRTPIAVITNHISALLSGKVQEKKEVRKYNNIILKEVIEMRELTENLLTISKLDALNYGVKKEKVNVRELIKNSIEKYESIELEKNLQVNLNVGKEEISSDQKLLKLAFDNLIQNAFKYSPYEGSIEIFQEKNYLIIRNETQSSRNIDVENILQPFSRGENALDMGVDGMGLGLSIIKKSLNLCQIPFEIYAEGKFFTIELKIFSGDIIM